MEGVDANCLQASTVKQLFENATERSLRLKCSNVTSEGPTRNLAFDFFSKRVYIWKLQTHR